MRVLILGGTIFIGRHIVEALLKAGHTVSILTRGHSPDPLPDVVKRLHGDRDDGAAGLAALTGRTWDACIDVSGYKPRQVTVSAKILQGSLGRYVFISAVSVYGDPQQRPVDEHTPLLPPAAGDVTEVDGDTYGPLKVACEQRVQQLYGARSTVLRPQIVVGPHDPSGRYAYWVNRAVQGSEILAPGDGSDHVQVIDVHDLARFVVTVVQDDVSGSFNLAGPRITWAEFMRVLGAQNVVWVPTELLSRLTFQELPLYRPEHGPRSGLMDVSSARAQTAGLRLTRPEQTAHDTRSWSLSAGAELNLEQALSPEQEAGLIRAARPS